MKDETVRRLHALTVASASSSCRVCRGDGQVDVDVQVNVLPRLVHAGALPCPHCQPGDGALLGLPIAHLPMRVDTPRSESA